MNCDQLQTHATPSRYLIKRPRALQWFHDGRLVKVSHEERQAGRFELFLDLLYVALVANFSDDLAEHADGAHLLKYVLIFTPAWHIWADLREMMNSFYTDDLVQRVFVLWVMTLLVLYGNNARRVDDGEDLTALRVTVGCYAVARLSTASFFLVTSVGSYQHRVQTRVLATCMVVGVVLTAPLFLRGVSVGAKVAVVLVIIVWSEASWAICLSPWIKKKLKLTYSIAVDIAHEIDRLAAFFVIILGEFLYSVIVGDPAGVGLTTGYGKAVCTLVIAFCLNWIYVTGDGSVSATHPIRRSGWTAFGFFLLHLPLSMSFLIGGHICAVSTRLEQFEDGQRWLLGGGLGVGMFCLWVFGVLFRSSDDGILLLPKQARIGMRLAAAVALVILPETHQHLSATQFVVVVMTLFILVLLWETIGGLQKGAQLWESWDQRHPPVSTMEDEQAIRSEDV